MQLQCAAVAIIALRLSGRIYSGSDVRLRMAPDSSKEYKTDLRIIRVGYRLLPVCMDQLKMSALCLHFNLWYRQLAILPSMQLRLERIAPNNP